jgi:uracil-DNA glycosylase family 4
LDQVLSAKKMKISGQNSMVSGKEVDPAVLAQLAYQTRNLLVFHLELGIADYPATPELRQFLEKEQPAATGSVDPVSRGTANNNPVPAAKISRESTARQLETISRQLTGCRICGSVTGPAIPGQGSTAPRLFVVGDSLNCADADSGMIWGAEEDELFWKMMAAIGLDQESVYVTNCIKCSRDNVTQLDAAAGQRCFPFLEQELAAIQPELICSMGEIATGLLLGSRVPLVRMRGHFHQYPYPHGNVARVMPTFHPRFLLQNPEMKRATWMDLQAVQREF